MTLVSVVLQERTSSRTGVFYLLVLLLSSILQLGICRLIRKIPADAENGDINVPWAAIRSLSGTYIAQIGSAAQLERAGAVFLCVPVLFSILATITLWQ